MPRRTQAAAEPARRWFGDLGGQPLALDLAGIEAAGTWCAELRRAFEQLTIAGGEQRSPGGVARARRAGRRAGERDRRRARAVLRGCPMRSRAGSPRSSSSSTATGIALAELGAGADHLASLREQIAMLASQSARSRAWARFHLARHAAKVAGIGSAIARDRARRSAGRPARRRLGARDAARVARRRDRRDARARAVPGLDAPLARRAVRGSRSRLARVMTKRPDRRAARGAPPARHGRDRDRDAAPRGEAGSDRPLRAVFAEIPTILPRLAPCVLRDAARDRRSTSIRH